MERNDLDQCLEFALGLASAAAHFGAAGFRNAVVRRKPDDSDVTATDLQIQRMVCERIRRRFPEHAIIAEENIDPSQGAPGPAEARYCWVVDPLDGTRNFVRGLSLFCTSIALLEAGRPVVGVVNNHLGACTYWAGRNLGARCGPRTMRIADTPFGGRTIVAFQPDSDGRMFDQADSWLRRVVLRNVGCTALHLAMVADGNIDGAVAAKCHLWDVAAGVLLAEEAGAKISDLEGQALFPFDLTTDWSRPTPVVAGSPATHAAVLEGLRR
jgi:myo-inositol-1(or 4)-monophosphatase